MRSSEAHHHPHVMFDQNDSERVFGAQVGQPVDQLIDLAIKPAAGSIGNGTSGPLARARDSSTMQRRPWDSDPIASCASAESPICSMIVMAASRRPVR